MSSHSNRLNDSKLLYVISDLGYSKDCSVITGIELLNEVKNYIPIPSILMSIPLIFFVLLQAFFLYGFVLLLILICMSFSIPIATVLSVS